MSGSDENSRGGQSVRLEPYLVSDFKLATGEVFPVVVRRDTRLPDTYALRYLLVAHRTPGASSNTMRNVGHGVAVGLSFLEARGIDLMQRLAAGLFLNREELAALANRCLTRADGKGAVVKSYAKRRYLDFANYLLWRFDAVLHRASAADSKILKLDRSAFTSRVKAQMPKGRVGAEERDRLGLLAAQRALLMEVTAVGSPRNPFLPKLQRRNRAMIMLHYSLGLRAGEMAGLHRSDYRNSENPAQIWVHTRHNFEGDRRRKPPRAKTKPRMLEISGAAEEALNVWLDHRADRTEFPLARTSHFLFVNRHGVELSLEAANDIFRRLVEIYPELRGLSAHVLRHDMNDRLVEDAEERRTSEDELTKDQQYINGWTENSTMPARYSKRSIARRANKRIYELQKRAVADGPSDKESE